MTWRIWNPSALLEECKMTEWLWKTFGSCSKIKSRISIWSSNFTSGYVLKPYWGFLDSSVGKKIYLLCRRPQLDSWIGKILRGRDRLPSPVFLGFPHGSAGKETICNAGDLGSIPGLGKYPREGKVYHSSSLAWRIPWTE